MSWRDTLEGRQALAARSMDRAVLNQARTAPEGWDARPDGTLVRRAPDPFSAGRLRQVAGLPEPDEEVVLDTRFHDGDDGCGFAWSIHDNTTLANRLPFGCPSEAEARAAFGDR